MRYKLITTIYAHNF